LHASDGGDEPSGRETERGEGGERMKTDLLRKYLLQLAIQGKLVPQQTSEGTAQDLVDNIREEKAVLVSEKKLKKDPKESYIYRDEEGHFVERIGKQEPVCIDNDLPFAVPEGWTWARLGEICINRDGERKPLADATRQKQKNKIYDYYGATGIIDKVNDYLFEGQLLLIGEDGANLVSNHKKNAFLVDGKYWVNNHAHVIDATHKSILYYIELVINSMSLKKGDFITGTAQPKLSQYNLNRIFLPLPPLAEQARIVKKMEELQKELEEMDASRTDMKKRCDLTRKMILQQAIKGALVPQQTSEGTAQDLVDNIREEKAVLVSEKKLKKDPNESYIYRDEEGHFMERIGKQEPVCIDKNLPFAVPVGWTWARLGSIATDVLGKTLDKLKNTGEYNPYLCNINIKWGSFDLQSIRKMRFEKEEIEKYNIKRNDLLLCEGGEIGKCAVWNEKETNLKFQNAIHRIRFFNDISPYFFMLFFMYYKASNKLEKYGKGVTIKHLTKESLNTIFLPLPPLAEQARIVKKVEELLEELDEMEKAVG
jgi:type I restriction enzyme S subunit